MVDFHTHILPQIDDGSGSLQESIAMLREEVRQRVDCVVLTPHFTAQETPQTFFRRRAAAYASLCAALREEKQVPEIRLGAEVSFFENMRNVRELDAMMVGETRLLLVEMPYRPWSKRMLQELYFLKNQRGIQPVLAHIERYLPMQPWGMLKELLYHDMRIQVNASFFINRQTERRAIRMLRQGAIHFLGSDCHNLRERKPNLRAALDIIHQKGNLSSRAIQALEMAGLDEWEG